LYREDYQQLTKTDLAGLDGLAYLSLKPAEVLELGALSTKPTTEEQMVFKHQTEQALDEWVGSYISDTHQNSEEARKFYLFVSQYLQDHGYRMNQAAMRNAIKRRFRQQGLALAKERQQRVLERITSAGQIFDFLKVTGR
jgi:hypothetical protein